ncbi:hypothetical protein Agub_g2657 [Astrephomene gubernaculifera]|uniref:Disease resistance R13L4/SHOC-2-like LRR domain-containing protein n=1 Tax=Astrephomene gubernaculifera TaxID=47775 RepID=A0AAD3DIK3_9CHLO|nr:hypothetical protein Agub_g2657 [Astrephomene gubernaculifera]
MGGLCSREESAPFDDDKSRNNPGQKPNADNNVASGAQPQPLESTDTASELLALKAQLQQLQDRNSALQKELSAAKDTARSYAELQSKHQELQTEHDGLQREFESARQQLAGAGLQAQLEARAEAERKLAEVQKQYSELKSMNNQLRRRVSDLATGHAEPPVALPAPEQVNASMARTSYGRSANANDCFLSQPCTAADEGNRLVLAKIRDSNPNSKISVAFWRSTDFRRWQGVRTANGEVTGLALSSMHLTVLPSEVGQLTSLTALLLSNNGLTQLPPTLGQLTSLTSLMLDGNNLKQLPAELCDLTQLQTLWLHDNQLACLPHALGKLTNLRQLIANDNALEQLPQSIGELKCLTSLWLDNNKLTELPETFSQLTELKRLRVDSFLAVLVPEQFRGAGTVVQPPSPRSGPQVVPAVQQELPGRGTEKRPEQQEESRPQQQEADKCCQAPGVCLSSAEDPVVAATGVADVVDTPGPLLTGMSGKTQAPAVTLLGTGATVGPGMATDA